MLLIIRRRVLQGPGTAVPENPGLEHGSRPFCATITVPLASGRLWGGTRTLWIISHFG
jgi:hypothetical protein